MGTGSSHGSGQNGVTLNTKVSIGLLAVLAPMLVSNIGLFFEVRAMRTELSQMWTVAEQVVWAERMKRNNPQLTVPEVSVIRKDIREPYRER